MREEAFAILEARHTGAQAHKVSAKFTKHEHVIQHFAAGVNFATLADLDQFPRQFRRPINDMARSTEIGRH